MKDTPEHRATATPFSLRENKAGDLLFSGYASTYDDYEVYGGPSNGMGWIERIDRGAFTRTLSEKPDLQLLINHEGMPLARTKSGTLILRVDDHGLHTEANLDKSDPDVQRLAPKMARRDMDEMSFAFRVKEQRWEAHPDYPDDPMSLRIITEVSLHKGDVSVVNYGANPYTNAELDVVGAVGVLAHAGAEELRSAGLDPSVVRRAYAALNEVRGAEGGDDGGEQGGGEPEGADGQQGGSETQEEQEQENGGEGGSQEGGTGDSDEGEQGGEPSGDEGDDEDKRSLETGKHPARMSLRELEEMTSIDGHRFGQRVERYREEDVFPPKADPNNARTTA